MELSLYQQRLDLKDADFTLIQHDEAMVALVYKVTHSNKITILKISSDRTHFFREIYFLERLSDKLPVPQIINTVRPEPDLDGAILMEYLPGSLLEGSKYSDKLAFEMGSLLGQLHNNSTSGYGDLIKPTTLTPDPRPYFIEKFEEGFSECSNFLPKQLLDKCMSYFNAHVNKLTSVDGPRLIHRDFRPGNIIVLDGKIRGIIDWASGRSGFAEEDFCCMEHREWSEKSKGKQSFLAGYSSIRKLPNYEDLMPLLRLKKAIEAIGFTVKRSTWNTTNAALYEFNRKYLEDTL